MPSQFLYITKAIAAKPATTMPIGPDKKAKAVASFPNINNAGPNAPTNNPVVIIILLVLPSKLINSDTKVFNLVTILVNAGNNKLPKD